MSRRKKKAHQIPILTLKIKENELDEFIQTCKIKDTPAFSVLKQQFQQKRIDSIVCRGIGDSCSSIPARTQVSFILSLAKALKISQLSFFDPLSCSSCCQYLTSQGFKCLETNTNGVFSFSEHTAYFMPHCPRFLYHNILISNWSPKMMQNLCIVGNSFKDYSEKCRLFIQNLRSAVEDLFDQGSIIETPLDFDNSEPFDSISYMTCDLSKLPPECDIFWSPRELWDENTSQLQSN